MLVVGDPLLMLVSMGQGLRVAGPLRAVPGCFLPVLMVPEGMGSHPEQLRHRGSGKKEKSGGEGSAERHARIVAHRVW
jgi:hypothetical protein